MLTTLAINNQIAIPVRVKVNGKLVTTVTARNTANVAVNAGDKLSCYINTLGVITTVYAEKTLTSADLGSTIAIGLTDLKGVAPSSNTVSWVLNYDQVMDIYEIQQDGTAKSIATNYNPQNGALTVPEAGFFYANVPGNGKQTKDELLWTAYLNGTDAGGNLQNQVWTNFISGIYDDNGNVLLSDTAWLYRINGNNGSPDAQPNDDTQGNGGRIVIHNDEIIVFESKNFGKGSGTKPTGKFWVFPYPIANFVGFNNGTPGGSYQCGSSLLATAYSQANFTGESKTDAVNEDFSIASFDLQGAENAAAAGIKVTNSLQEDYDDAHVDAQGNHVQLANMVTSLSPQDTTITGFRLESELEDVEVTVNGKSMTLQPGKPSAAIPLDMGRRLTITMPTAGTPAATGQPFYYQNSRIYAQPVRTSGTATDHNWVTLYPSQDITERIANMGSSDANDLTKANLNFKSGVTADEKTSVQNAMKQMASTSLSNNYQTGDNHTSNNLVFEGGNMSDPFWHITGIGSSMIVKDSPSPVAYATFDTNAAYLDHLNTMKANCSVWEDTTQDTLTYVEGLESWHSFWHKVKEGLADIEEIAARAIEAAEHAAEKVAQDVEKAVEAAITYVEDGVMKGIKFIVTTAEQIGAMIQSVVKAIINVIEEVWDFLKMLFAWGDIKNTQKALEAGFNDYFLGATDTLKKYQGTGGLVSDLEAFHDWVDKELGITDFNRNSGSSTNPTVDKIMAALTWLQTKLLGAIPQLPVSGEYDTNITQELEALMEKVTDDFISDLIGDIQSTMTLMSGLMRSGSDITEDIKDFVAHILDTIFDIVEDLIEGILEILIDLMQYMHDMMNKSFGAAPLKWLWKLVDGQDLTPLSLVSLCVAFPGTLAYKVIAELEHATKKKPFEDGQTYNVTTGEITTTTTEGVTASTVDITLNMVLAAMSEFISSITTADTTVTEDGKGFLPGKVKTALTQTKTILGQAKKYTSYISSEKDEVQKVLVYVQYFFTELGAFLQAGKTIAARSKNENSKTLASQYGKVKLVVGAMSSAFNIGVYIYGAVKASKDNNGLTDYQIETLTADLLDSAAGVCTLAQFANDEEIQAPVAACQAIALDIAGVMRIASGVAYEKANPGVI